MFAFATRADGDKPTHVVSMVSTFSVTTPKKTNDPLQMYFLEIEPAKGFSIGCKTEQILGPMLASG